MVAVAAQLSIPAAADAAAAAVVCPASAPTEAAGTVAAMLCGGQVPIDGDESETTQVVALPNGSFQAQVAAGPVRMKQNGTWVPVDLTMRTNTDGSISPTAQPAGLVLSGAAGAGANELAAIGNGDDRVAVDWSDALPAPVLSGNTATYADVRPGIDLMAVATRTGVELDVVVKNRVAISQIAGIRLPVVSKADASYQQDTGGNLVMRDSAGKVIARSPAMQMWDARTDPLTGQPIEQALGSVVSSVSQTKGLRGKGMSLGLAPDAAWLNSSSRQFPITLDPVINPEATTFDTYVLQNNTTDHGGATDLQLGLINGNIARSFISWDMTNLEQKQITAATAYFYNFWSQTCTPANWDVWETKSANLTPAVTWATQPTWITDESTSASTKGFSSSCDDGWVSVDAKNFFQDASDTGQYRGYMGIRATNETTTAGFKQFRSRNATDDTQVPYAVVTYNDVTPVAPMDVKATDVNTATPLLSGVVTSDRQSAIDVDFNLQTAGGTQIGGSPTATGEVASGDRAAYQVPAGTLTAGQTYRFNLTACYPDTGACTAPSPWVSFTPTTPTSTIPTGDITLVLPAAAVTSMEAITDAGACAGSDCATQNDTQLNVGGDGTHHWISALKTVTSAIPAGARIDSATLALTQSSCLAACGSQTVNVYPADTDVAAQTTGPALLAASDPKPLATVPTGTQTIDITRPVIAWQSGAVDNDGLVLQTNDETTATTGVTYASTTAAAGAPVITIAYRPPTIPSAPVNVTATAGDGGAVVRWDAPADSGVADGLDQSLTYTLTVLKAGTIVQTISLTGTHSLVTGLTNAQPYTFSVATTNSIGTGPSTVSAATTPTAVTNSATYVTAINQYLAAQDKLVTGTVDTAKAALTGASQANALTARLTAETATDTAVPAMMAVEQMAYTAYTTTASQVVVTLAGTNINVYVAASQTFTTQTGIGTSTTESVPGDGAFDNMYVFLTGASPTMTSYVNADELIDAPDASLASATSVQLDGTPIPQTSTSLTTDTYGYPTFATATAPADTSKVSRTGIAAWATSGAASATPKHPNHGDNSYGNDCTDFVSRSLLYGGHMHMKPDYFTWWTDESDYFWEASNAALLGIKPSHVSTHSWGLVQHLQQFFQREFAAGANVTAITSVQVGDIAFVNWHPYDSGNGGPGIDHVGVITKTSNNQLFITQHTIMRYNEPIWGTRGSATWQGGNGGVPNPNLLVYVYKVLPKYY